MKRKISTFNHLIQTLVPHTATVLSGSFEPFDEYYFRLLQWGAKQGHPFVVIIQKDDMVLKRRGFKALSSTHETRAEIISSLEFVDYVIIINKTAHDRDCIAAIKPKTIVFQRDNLAYRRVLAREIKKDYPDIRIVQTTFDRDAIAANAFRITLLKKMTTPIAQSLIKHSALSHGKSSKISALLVNKNNRILLTEKNNETEEHTEILLLKKSKGKRFVYG